MSSDSEKKRGDGGEKRGDGGRKRKKRQKKIQKVGDNDDVRFYVSAAPLQGSESVPLDSKNLDSLSMNAVPLPKPKTKQQMEKKKEKKKRRKGNRKARPRTQQQHYSVIGVSKEMVDQYEQAGLVKFFGPHTMTLLEKVSGS